MLVTHKPIRITSIGKSSSHLKPMGSCLQNLSTRRWKD